MCAVGLAIIGCGAELDRYLETGLLSLRGQANFVACFSRRPERAAAGAVKLEGAQPFVDLDALLAEPAIHAVIVATPHDSHRDITLRALAAGKHVLVEKPIATSLDDARQMVQAARAAGRVLAVFENYHFFAPFLEGRRLITNGEIGRLVTMRFTRTVYLQGPWLREGWRGQGADTGMLLDQACHYVDGLRVLAGEEIIQVEAMATQTRPDFIAEDTIMLNFRFASGLIGQGFMTWGSDTPDRGAEAEVYGQQGSLTVYRWPVGLVLHRRDLPDGQSVQMPSADYADSFVPTIADFLAAVRGEREPYMSGLEGFRDLAVVDAARRAIASGCTEDVEEF
ncbi:MAG: Gfo/Idh/MocA family protein [Chloroflexota bacterium]